LTNDFRECHPRGEHWLEPISLVCKLTSAEGKPAVKLSDNYLKASGRRVRSSDIAGIRNGGCGEYSCGGVGVSVSTGYKRQNAMVAMAPLCPQWIQYSHRALCGTIATIAFCLLLKMEHQIFKWSTRSSRYTLRMRPSLLHALVVSPLMFSLAMPLRLDGGEADI